MPKIEKIIEDCDWLSDRISSQVRLLGAAVLGIVFTILISEAKTFTPSIKGFTWLAWTSAAFAIVALLTDFLQYVFGYTFTKRLLNQLERAGKNEGKYNYKGYLYRARVWLFRIKLGLVALAAILILILLVMLATHTGSQSQ